MSDNVAPPDRPEPTPQEKDIAQAARLLRLAAQYRLNVSGMWLSEQQAMVDLAIRLEALVAVPARAHHQQDEETKDVMARSGTREIRDRQPAAVTDAGHQDDCAGTMLTIRTADILRFHMTLVAESASAHLAAQRESMGRIGQAWEPIRRQVKALLQHDDPEALANAEGHPYRRGSVTFDRATKQYCKLHSFTGSRADEEMCSDCQALNAGTETP